MNVLATGKVTNHIANLLEKNGLDAPVQHASQSNSSYIMARLPSENHDALKANGFDFQKQKKIRISDHANLSSHSDYSIRTDLNEHKNYGWQTLANKVLDDFKPELSFVSKLPKKSNPQMNPQQPVLPQIGSKVSHRLFGEGAVIGHTPNGVSVSFNGNEKIIDPTYLSFIPNITKAEGGDVKGYTTKGAVMDALELAKSVKPVARVRLSEGGVPDIKNPMSVFPKPQRMFPEGERPAGGQYLSMPDKQDVTGHKSAAASIGIGSDGKPYFTASRDAVDETGTSGKGSAVTKTNLFKKKAGWRWQDAPEGHEDTNTIVSVTNRGKHYYALNAHFPKGVDLARYENAPSEPRLRPTTQGNIDLGPQAGSILVRGKEHPVYHHVIVKADGGGVLGLAKSIEPVSGYAKGGRKKSVPLNWDDIPDINPQDLVGKKVFPIFADLTKAGDPYTGIDSSKLKKPEGMFGGPGYPLLPESQKHGLAWAVEGKGRGSSKIRKDADYVIVHAMEQTSHQSNASFANSLMKTMKQYVNDNRFNPEAVQQIDDMVRRPTEQKELQSLKNFPGFGHKNAENFLRKLSFEARLRVARVLESTEAQNLGAPNIDKITRATLDPNFAGVPSRYGMFVMEIPKGSEDEQLVHLKSAGLPEHPSYQYGIKGRIVGKFRHPVAPEVLFHDWFAQQDLNKVTEKGRAPNIRRAFDLAMPTVTISQDVADRLPHRPQDIQSAKAAQLALNAFNDQWHDTDTKVTEGGLGAAQLSKALKSSDSSSTLSQYEPDEINAMKKDGKFTGYKLKDGEVYFGLKKGTNYANEYGFDHPELTDNETALTSVVNNEPGAKGIGGAPVVLKALQHGATALDAYAVPTDKYPDGFLPDFYSHFGFKELGRVPFDPKYVTPQQFNDMKHEWSKTGWDEKRHGLPSLAIMKWKGSNDDRQDAVRRFVQKSSQSDIAGSHPVDVGGAAGVVEPSVGPSTGQAGVSGLGNTSGNRGAVGADNAPRPSDRFTRTLAAVKGLSPDEIQHFGLNPADIEQAKASGLANGGEVEPTLHEKLAKHQENYIPHDDPRRGESLAEFHKDAHPDLKNPDGSPKVFYHATRALYQQSLQDYDETPDFQEFDTKSSEMGSHFGSKEQAGDFTGSEPEQRGHMYPVHLNIKNPIRLEDYGSFSPRRAMGQLSKEIVGKSFKYLENSEPQEALQNALKEHGHDGIVYLNRREGLNDYGKRPNPENLSHLGDDAFKKIYPEAQDSYIAFDPEQIKSATGNQGTFDPSKPKMNEARGGFIHPVRAISGFHIDTGKVGQPMFTGRL